MKFDDKLMHTIQLFMLLTVATVLIIFAHSYIAPEIVFSSMIAGLAGIVGSRIAANGYLPSTTPGATTPPVSPSSVPSLAFDDVNSDTPTAKMKAVVATQPAIKRVPVVRAANDNAG